MTESEILARLRTFLQETFLYMKPDYVLSDDDSLLRPGVYRRDVRGRAGGRRGHRGESRIAARHRPLRRGQVAGSPEHLALVGSGLPGGHGEHAAVPRVLFLVSRPAGATLELHIGKASGGERAGRAP